MNPSEIIKLSGVSKALTGNDQNIRGLICPKKYYQAVKELNNYVIRWIHKWESEPNEMSAKDRYKPANDYMESIKPNKKT